MAFHLFSDILRNFGCVVLNVCRVQNDCLFIFSLYQLVSASNKVFLADSLTPLVSGDIYVSSASVVLEVASFFGLKCKTD